MPSSSSSASAITCLRSEYLLSIFCSHGSLSVTCRSLVLTPALSLQMADRMVGVFKTSNISKSVTINPNSFAIPVQ
jgi:hypothetical protein